MTTKLTTKFDHQIHSLNKLTGKELYLILVEGNTLKPAAQNHFENLFETSQFKWKNMYFLIRNTTLDTKPRMLQYKVLHNILCANEMLFKLGKVTSPRCSFCKLQDETVVHLSYDYLIVKELWNQLKSILSNNVIFPKCTPQSAIFIFWDLDTNEHLILNKFLLISKIYIYNARKTGYLNISHILIYIKGIKYTRKKLCENNARRRKKINRWKNVLIN